jgi:hypothetical protein
MRWYERPQDGAHDTDVIAAGAGLWAPFPEVPFRALVSVGALESGTGTGANVLAGRAVFDKEERARSVVERRALSWMICADELAEVR